MRRRWMLAGAAALVIAFAGVACADGTNEGRMSRERSASSIASTRSTCEAMPTTERKTRIATAKLIIEYNATDEDVGVHGAFDDDGWETLCVFDPTGRPVLEVSPRGQLLDLTMAGIFFESREPPFEEFSFADLRAAFPEGQYSVTGTSFDGTIMTGEARFTHDVPAAPVIITPSLAEEPEATGESLVPTSDVVVTWEAVTETVDGESVEITGYEVIVTKEEHDDSHGFSRPIYDVHVPPNVRRLSVPAQFLEPDTVYELEVLALEASGNQTISVGFFRTRQPS
jgi:hypothetical protein